MNEYNLTGILGRAEMSDEKLTRIGRYQTAWNRSDLERELRDEDQGDPAKIKALRDLGRKLKPETRDPEGKKD